MMLIVVQGATANPEAVVPPLVRLLSPRPQVEAELPEALRAEEQLEHLA